MKKNLIVLIPSPCSSSTLFKPSKPAPSTLSSPLCTILLWPPSIDWHSNRSSVVVHGLQGVYSTAVGGEGAVFGIAAVRAEATDLEHGGLATAWWSSFERNNKGAAMGRGGTILTMRGGDLKKVVVVGGILILILIFLFLLFF